MPDSIRSARVDDADFLNDIIDIASEGVIPQAMERFAGEGMTVEDIGRGMVAADAGPFSHRRARIVEADGHPAGAVISYAMTADDAAEQPGMQDVFLVVNALERQAVGAWFVNIIAVRDEYRGRGLARAMLEDVERQARLAQCPRLALIVAASNAPARQLYDTWGFRPVDRVPFDVTEFGGTPTEAILMFKDL